MSIKNEVVYIYDNKPKNQPPKIYSEERTYIIGELSGPASYADKILKKYGFPKIIKTAFYFIENSDQYSEACRTIDFYFETMKKYNFDRETSIRIVSDNIGLFRAGKEELNKKVDILKEFSLDKEFLTKITYINSMSSKTLYNIVQYLKAFNFPITIKNIEELYREKKENIFEFNKLIDSRSKNYIGILVTLGYSKEEAEFVLKQNPCILRIDIADLRKLTAILWQYGLDVQMLTKNDELKKINPKVLYAITETIKSMQLEVTEDNISDFYEKSDRKELLEIVNCRKLTTGKMGVIYSQFNRK